MKRRGSQTKPKSRARHRKNPAVRVMEFTLGELYDEFDAGSLVGHDDNGKILRVSDYARLGQLWLCNKIKETTGEKEWFLCVSKRDPSSERTRVEGYAKIRLVPSNR